MHNLPCIALDFFIICWSEDHFQQLYLPVIQPSEIFKYDEPRKYKHFLKTHGLLNAQYDDDNNYYKIIGIKKE